MRRRSSCPRARRVIAPPSPMSRSPRAISRTTRRGIPVTARLPWSSRSPAVRIAWPSTARAWRATPGRAGRRPPIEDPLREAPAAERAAMLFELLALEVELRRECGEHPTAEEYRARFPEHVRVIDDAFGAPAPSSGPDAVTDPGATIVFE